MYLYNSATHKKEEFKTHTPGRVEMYTCGPTVYHFAHIGNLRSYIMEDVLEKFLRWTGYDVHRVMNITDVGHLTSDADEGEDKMLKGAKREHKTVMEIAQFYTDAFFEDCRRLNIKTPDVVQPATGCIDEYIKIVSKLMDTGYAYFAGGNVYFDTSKLGRYYVFNDHDEEDLAVGVREGVEEDPNKRNKNDFVLWFTKSKFEDQALKWDSPWGVGYPGWHIECSGISLKYNGEYLDLHCGGVDNAFPHHTNEIAQSESYLGHPWCPQWFHVHHLNTSDGKMSKSKGEFLTVSLLEQKGYDPLAYRYFCLQSHYRKALVFTWENLDNAAAAYTKLIARIAALDPADGPVDQEAMKPYREKFGQQMGNDLNTSMGVTALFDVLKAKTNDATKLALIGDFDSVLSLGLLEKAAAKRAEAAQAIRDAGSPALLHCDAVQAFLKVPFTPAELGVDLLTLSGHKIRAPKGIGVQYIRRGLNLKPLLTGGGQEGGLRPGTEPTAQAAALAAACAAWQEDYPARIQGIKEYALESLSAVPGLEIISRGDAPHICAVSLPGYPSEMLVRELSDRGVYVSSGSACHRGKPSHVFAARGLPKRTLMGVLRVSFSPESTRADVDALAGGLTEIAKTRIAAR